MAAKQLAFLISLSLCLQLNLTYLRDVTCKDDSLNSVLLIFFKVWQVLEKLTSLEKHGDTCETEGENFTYMEPKLLRCILDK